MSLFELHSNNISVQYKNTFCSKATFFVIITTFIALIFPLILAYRTRGFWLKNYTFYEQSNVHFKYQYLFIIETDDIEYVISCGSLSNITNLLLENCNSIKVREIDYNLDKKIDEIYLDVQIDNPLQKSIISVKMILIVDYMLDGLCPLQMEGLIFHEQSFGISTAKYFIFANLKWIQTVPLPCLYNYKDIRYNYSTTVMDNSEMDTWLRDTLYEYSKRSASVALTNPYAVKIFGITSTYNMEISITIPEHAIRYKPGLWQELKFSWQQYLSIAIIFYWILIKIKSYVFNNRLLPAWKNDPLKKNI